jgi:error-prone DNA polymerase
MLTAVRKCFALIKDHHQEELTMATIPDGDGPTYGMIQKADTVGTFQIESRAQMSMLPRLLPNKFYDLVIEVAIVRPGPIQGGMVHPYLRRRQGIDKITYPDPRLIPILERTQGVPIFQEQVMRIAMAVGDFTPGEANELRRNMGAWSFKGDLGPWLRKMADGMKRNGISKDFSDAILKQMLGFSEYGFPESHAISFALIAYVSSYLKCHFPAAFFASVINSQPMGFYSTHSLLQAAQHDGVTVLPLDINKSTWDLKLENLQGRQAIRLGYRMVHGLSRKTIEQLEECFQRDGPWQSWDDFLKSTSQKLYKHDLTILAAAGAFICFGMPRRSAIWMAAAAPFSSWLEDIEDVAVFKEETPEERIQSDFHSFSTSTYDHPARYLREEGWCYPVDRKHLKLANQLNSLIPNQKIHVFGMIVIKQRPPSAKGMMFYTLEDETGFINLAFTPQCIDSHAAILQGQSFLCIYGKLQKQGAGHSILVDKVYLPNVRKADVIPMPQPLQDMDYGSLQHAWY